MLHAIKAKEFNPDTGPGDQIRLLDLTANKATVAGDSIEVTGMTTSGPSPSYYASGPSTGTSLAGFFIYTAEFEYAI